MPVTRSQSERLIRVASRHPYRQPQPHPPTPTGAQNQIGRMDESYRMLGIFEAFGKNHDGSDQQTQPERAQDILSSVRGTIRQEIVRLLSEAVAQNTRLSRQLEVAASPAVCRLEMIRQEVIKDFLDHDQYITQHTVIDSSVTVGKLRDHVEKIEGITDFRDRTNAKFAAGVILMILEELVGRASSDQAERRVLYERLIRCSHPQDRQLPIAQHIQEFPEDIIESYVHIIERTIQALYELPAEQRPSTNMTDALHEKIRPILARRT